MQTNIRNNLINLLLILAFLLLIIFICKVPYINTFSHEEKLLSLLAVKNFERYGLLETYLLPNYAFTKGAMPYVYTHLNDLPSILNYLLLKLWNDLIILRVFYTAITLAACSIMYLVFRGVASHHVILSTIFVFITEKYYIHSIDHLHNPLTLLAYSIQLYILFKIQSRQNVTTALNIIFTSTFSWFACMTLVIGVCIYACKNIKEIKIKLIIYTLLAFVSSIIIKVINNSLYLGFELALSEIINTITNRIYNYPTFSEMYKNLQENGIVQWGSQTILEREGVLHYYAVVLIKLITSYIITIMCVFALLYSAPSMFAEIIKRNKDILVKLFLVILSLGAWEIFFPSHAKGYTNNILINFLLVLRYVIFAYILLEIIYIANIKLINIKKVAYIYTIYMVLFGMINITNILYQKKYVYFEPPNELIDTIKGKVVYTNISAVFIGYFQNEIHLAGRCLPESVGKVIIGNCNNIFENVYDVSTHKKFSNPDYFIFNNQLTSGNMSYTKEKDLIWYEKYLDEKMDRIKTYQNEDTNYKYILYKFK